MKEGWIVTWNTWNSNYYRNKTTLFYDMLHEQTVPRRSYWSKISVSIIDSWSSRQDCRFGFWHSVIVNADSENILCSLRKRPHIDYCLYKIIHFAFCWRMGDILIWLCQESSVSKEETWSCDFGLLQEMPFWVRYLWKRRE